MGNNDLVCEEDYIGVYRSKCFITSVLSVNS